MLTTNPIEIELTTKCTLGCPACPRNDNDTEAERLKLWDVGHMDTNLAKSFADSPTDRDYLFVGCYGDPIYHPDFIDIVKYYVDRDRRLTIHTNGSFKKQKFWDELTNLNWSRRQIFNFSVDGLEDTNHLYRIRANWKHIMMGMKAMGALPLDRRPIVDWKFLVFPYNEHQVEDARKLANSLGMDRFLPVTSEREIKFYNTDTPELYEWPKQ